MSNNGIPPLNDWQADNYPVIYDEGAETSYYVKTGAKIEIPGGSSYLVYTALLTQTGTNAPVATVLENTLGDTFGIDYNAVGSFLLYPATTEPFTINKTAVFIGTSKQLNGTASFEVYRSNAVGITILTFTWDGISSFIPANGVLNETVIEIRVYP